MRTIEITESGHVTIVNGDWRATIDPGNLELATALLCADGLAQVEAAWTDELIAAWQATQPVPVEPGPILPTVEERLAAVEDAVLELALGAL